jgi:hypothetical protein
MPHIQIGDYEIFVVVDDREKRLNDVIEVFFIYILKFIYLFIYLLFYSLFLLRLFVMNFYFVEFQQLEED